MRPWSHAGEQYGRDAGGDQAHTDPGIPPPMEQLWVGLARWELEEAEGGAEAPARGGHWLTWTWRSITRVAWTKWFCSCTTVIR